MLLYEHQHRSSGIMMLVMARQQSLVGFGWIKTEPSGYKIDFISLLPFFVDEDDQHRDDRIHHGDNIRDLTVE